MRLPKWNRKQKLIRNLLVAGGCLFLMAWYQGFPVRSYEALLQRAAGAYLIESPVELLYVDEEALLVYGAADGKLLRVGYGSNLFGIQMNQEKLYPEHVRYILEYNAVDYERETDAYQICLRGSLTGFLRDVASAELEVTLRFCDPVTGTEASRETRTLSGVREGPHRVRFLAAADDRDGRALLPGPAVLRLYDAEGTLLEKRAYEVLGSINV